LQDWFYDPQYFVVGKKKEAECSSYRENEVQLNEDGPERKDTSKEHGGDSAHVP